MKNDLSVSLVNPFFGRQGIGAGWAQLQPASVLLGLSRARLDRDDVLRLIDSRQIRWAWDISRQGARRPEVRIWRQSLLDFLARENGGTVPSDGRVSLEKVIATILPPVVTPRSGMLKATELHRRFLCCTRHVRALVADGELASDAPPSACPRTLSVSYVSTVEFLKRRCLSI